MIAYSKTGLDNLYIQEEAEVAFSHQCITEEEQVAIKERYPVGFYTPNFFIRVGLFILTAVIAGFSLGLFFLITYSGGNVYNPIGLFFFFTALSYVGLELFVRREHHYRSGVDDALLWTVVICFIAGLNCINGMTMLGYSLFVFLLSGYLALRFADALMSALACVCWLGFLFFAYMELGAIAKLTMPFVMMAAAAVLYFWRQRMAKAAASKYYRHCLMVVKVVALLSFYAAGNYFVVREIGNSLFELNLKEGQSIPFGWLFWALTVSIPMLYLLRGVQKKDAVFLRVGLLLLAVMIFTIRYYHHIMPLEIVMILGGMIMITVAYVLIRYLQQPHNGFTYKEEKEASPISKLQVEALLINQTFSTPQAAETGTRFGGGSGGGAGAGGEY
jgi:hypothetical protein